MRENMIVLATAAAAAAFLLPSVAVSGQKKADRLFDVAKVFHGSPAAVDKALGTPSKTYTSYGEDYREYQKPRGKVVAQFDKGKAVAFELYLKPPAGTPEQAVALIGFKTAGRKPPAVKDLFRWYWRGKDLGHPAIKEVSVTKVNGPGWDLVVAKNYY